MNERLEAVRLLQRFSEAPGPPSREDAIRQVFRDELKEGDAYTFSSDRSGSLMASPGGEGEAEGPRVMLTAHMDEVGFMVQNITRQGFLQFVPLGGWWSHTVLAQGVEVINAKGERVPGCVASIPPHQLSEDAQSRLMKLDQMSIDVGGESREQVTDEMGIHIGDVIVPATRFQPLANSNRFLGKAFDNRVGMALLTQTLQQLSQKDLPHQLLGVATVQEELGCRGAVTASALAKPDVAIVLEGPPADDTPGMSREDCQGALGGGAQIRIMDPRAVSSRRLVDFVVNQARGADIAHQVTVRRGGGTDASSIQLHDLGVPCVVLGVPVRYIHSHHAILDIRDYLQVLKLIEVVLKALDREAVEQLSDFVS